MVKGFKKCGINVRNVWKKCEICLEEKSFEIYFPFRSPPEFSYQRKDIDAKDSIAICRNCEYLISQIRRANGTAFFEAVTIGDFADVVRKVYRL